MAKTKCGGCDTLGEMIAQHYKTRDPRNPMRVIDRVNDLPPEGWSARAVAKRLVYLCPSCGEALASGKMSPKVL